MDTSTFSSTDMPILFLSCCIAVGFITATSMTLVNSVGETLHGLQDGVQKYRGDEVEKRKKAIRVYPAMIFVMYAIVAILLLVMASVYLFDIELFGVEPKGMTGAPWAMVVFSAAYIAYMIWTMRRVCLTLFDAMRD